MEENGFLVPTSEESRALILDFQRVVSELETEFPVDCPLKHHFAPGLYAREIFLPKGSVVVGKIHKHAHVNNISQGHVMVYTEEGLQEFIAPYQFISLPGTKRVVCALEDTIWTTYHPTEETDLEIIEQHVIAKDFEEYDKFALEQKEILRLKNEQSV